MQDGWFGWFDGLYAAPQEAGVPFNWEPYELRVPAHWPAGAYVAVLVEGSRRDRPVSLPDRATPDSREGKVLFVVRRHPAKTAAVILYKIPLFTYHAYNVADVAYARETSARRPEGDDAQTFYTGTDRVSLLRPGGGTGGTPWDSGHAPDVYDRSSPRQTFAHWDAPFIAWLETAGYDLDYCTDLDLHELPASVLARHRLILSAGHDEYWSDDMRWHLERYLEGGGNAAFFAGNVMWWRVRVRDENTRIERAGHFCDRADPWTGDAYEESALSGVTFAHGGGRWIGERLATGFTVVDPSHWAFTGTGLAEGEAFGARSRLVGYECDGQSFSWTALAQRGTIEPDATHRVPRDFKAIAYADLRDWDVDGHNGEILGNGSAIVGTSQRGQGTLFVAGTTDWPRVVAQGDRTVGRITRNVLDRLSSAPAAAAL